MELRILGFGKSGAMFWFEIKWEFVLTVHFKHEIIGKHLTEMAHTF